ncbi:hypothetical protein [Mycolicibacterium mageritense]|uniref:hypothetical protein n=1 Tax=Mycolicibacterium mageritense TaxID=53462 RepID=UPI000435F72D|nr:hypothetical protein [Mycolicibacterium mageritense]CDO22049.1 hypothetical protein BN978_02514 [Mycolicibacterium mageritense DSM 44476 = CIP 104973]
MSPWLGSKGGAADTWAEERRRLAQEVELAAFAERVIGRADSGQGAGARSAGWSWASVRRLAQGSN